LSFYNIAAPLDSSSLSIGSPRSTTNSGRTRWQYTVSWQVNLLHLLWCIFIIIVA